MRKNYTVLPLLLISFSAYAQTRIIGGKVTDTTGLPLPGVNVTVQGTHRGTATDSNGNYSISVDRLDTLVFTYVGMLTQRIRAGQQSTLDVILKEASQMLGEVVITGYQRSEKKLFTGAASKLKMADIDQAGVPEVSRMLEGKVSGVSLQNVSGTFGSGPKITIRGASSIYGQTRPLWVVDGVVQEEAVNITADQLSSGNANTVIASSIAGLNPDDIESIEVLKDASATSLYGARALNGVVVVTTKTGKRGALTVHYRGDFSTRLKPSYNEYDILNSQDQMSVLLDMERKGLLNYTSVIKERNSGIYGLYYRGLSELNPDGSFEQQNTPEAKAAFLRKYEYVNTDWFNVLFRNTQMQTHSLSLSWGGKRSSVYASMSYLTDPGWSIADQTRRLTADINSRFDVTDKLQISLLTTSSLRKQNLPGTFDRNLNSVFGKNERAFDINPFSYALNTSRASRPYDDTGHYEYYRANWTDFNIIEELRNNKIKLDLLDAKIQADLKYDVAKSLKYQFKGSMRYVKATQRHMITEHANAARAYRAIDDPTVKRDNIFLFEDPDFPNRQKKSVLPYGGFYNLNRRTLESFYVRNTLSYNLYFNGTQHSINAFMGQELRYLNRDKSFNENPGVIYDEGMSSFIDPDFYKYRVSMGKKLYDLSYERNRFLAFFAKLGYVYRDKYILNLTGRYDGSNKLGRSARARWLPTWNLSGAWNIGRESFLKKFRAISSLKLRATYGLTANTGIAKNSLAVFKGKLTRRELQPDKERLIEIKALENADLTWEKQYEINTGLDLGLWDDRVALTTDLYWRKGYDLIDSIRTSGIGGQYIRVANNADMKTYGFELGVNTQNFRNERFKWNTNLIGSWVYKQRITELKTDPMVIDLVGAEGGARLGHEQRAIYSIPFKRLNDRGEPVLLDENGEAVQEVDFQSKKVGYLKYEGPVTPTLTMGLTNRFRYKNFELEFFLSYQGGNKIRLGSAFSHYPRDLSVFTKESKDRWMIPGDEKKTDIPGIPSKVQIDNKSELQYAYQAYNLSDQRVADGDFLRLKTIGLTYHFDGDLVKALGLKRMSLQIQAVNPWLIYSDGKLHGQDPEFFRSGGVAYPISKQLTLTCKVGF